MPHLTAVAFRIQNYRNIDDSGWIELERVTNLVGRNESGKTALLQALHKFHPATEIPYVAQREFPRDRFTRDFKDPGNWPVSSVKFKIEGEVCRTLEAITAPNAPPDFVTATRYYDGKSKPDDVPAEVLGRAANLFVEINKRF